MYSLVRELSSFSPIQIPFGLLPVNKQKPHKHVTIGFCRKQQVSSVLVATELSKARTQRALSELFLGEERSIQYLLWLDLARAGAKFCSVLMRNNFQGYSVLGHCMMLLLFILSLILIVALMYWMVRIAAASHCPDWWIVSGLELMDQNIDVIISSRLRNLTKIFCLRWWWWSQIRNKISIISYLICEMCTQLFYPHIWNTKHSIETIKCLLSKRCFFDHRHLYSHWHVCQALTVW